jgi:RNA polymerase sigma-70 factor (ECF subfamily)
MRISNGNDRFATTRWSLVLAAKDKAAPEARQALADLCTAYWYPLYAYVRRQGHDAEQAQDLTQEFFTRLLEKDFLRAVDPVRGRFRAFLLAALRHFLANEWDRAKASKRGGGRRLLSLDCRAAEDRYRLEPAHQLTAEKLFERRYALTLLEQVLQRLKREMARAGKDELFEGLKQYLAGAAESGYAETARALNMSDGALKTAVHRLRRRYRELLREAIAETVETDHEIDEEIRDLFAALGT